MTAESPRRPAEVHGEVVQVYAGEQVAEVMSAFLARHAEEINADLAPLGVTIAELGEPAWMRIVWTDDMREALTPAPKGRRRG